MFLDCSCDGGVEELSEGGEADYDFVYVSIGEILGDCGDKHDEQVAVAIEEERAHEVAESLEDQIFVLGEVDGVDVREGRRLAQHFDVHSAN